MPLKLGKRAPRANRRTLRLADYLPVTLVVPEVREGWELFVPDSIWAASMLGNDEVGDCVIAMILHYIMLATAASGKPVTFTKQQALDLYTAITGYNPADPSTDQGTVITDALEYWQTKGVYGHFIKGWASFDYTDQTKLNYAIDIFGAALCGIQVTDGMMDQFTAGQAWNAPYSGPVDGGHGIPLPGFGREGRTCITWGKRQEMDLGFIAANGDEAYVVITDDFLDAAQKTPLGIDIAALQADLQGLQSSAT